MAENSIDTDLKRQEIAKSNVRIRITYLFGTAYILGIAWFLYVALETQTEPNTQLAIGIISGLGSAALGVIGFWFGGRKVATDMLASAQASLATLPSGGVKPPSTTPVKPPLGAIGSKPTVNLDLNSLGLKPPPSTR